MGWTNSHLYEIRAGEIDHQASERRGDARSRQPTWKFCSGV